MTRLLIIRLIECPLVQALLAFLVAALLATAIAIKMDLDFYRLFFLIVAIYIICRFVDLGVTKMRETGH